MAHEVSDIVPEAVQGDKDATRTANNVVKKADGTLLEEGITEEEWTQGKTDGIYENNTSWASSMTTPVYQAIDQSKLVPLLVKTIQEQQTIIEDLQSRVTTLEG